MLVVGMLVPVTLVVSISRIEAEPIVFVRGMSTVTAVDVANRQVVGVYTRPPCTTCSTLHGLAVSRDGTRAYVGIGPKVLTLERQEHSIEPGLVLDTDPRTTDPGVIDALTTDPASGNVYAAQRLYKQTPQGIRYDDTTIFLIDADNHLWTPIVQLGRADVVQLAATRGGQLVTSFFDRSPAVLEYRIAVRQQDGGLRAANLSNNRPDHFAIGPDGQYAYVALSAISTRACRVDLADPNLCELVLGGNAVPTNGVVVTKRNLYLLGAMLLRFSFADSRVDWIDLPTPYTTNMVGAGDTLFILAPSPPNARSQLIIMDTTRNSFAYVALPEVGYEIVVVPDDQILALTPSASPTATSTPSPNPSSTSSPAPTTTARPATTPTQRPTYSLTPTASRTLTASPTLTARATSSPSSTTRQCPGDCNHNNVVTIDELVRAVTLALRDTPPEECPSLDSDLDGTVRVHELVEAVRRALTGC